MSVFVNNFYYTFNSPTKMGEKAPDFILRGRLVLNGQPIDGVTIVNFYSDRHRTITYTYWSNGLQNGVYGPNSRVAFENEEARVHLREGSRELYTSVEEGRDFETAMKNMGYSSAKIVRNLLESTIAPSKNVGDSHHNFQKSLKQIRDGMLPFPQSPLNRENTGNGANGGLVPENPGVNTFNSNVQNRQNNVLEAVADLIRSRPDNITSDLNFHVGQNNSGVNVGRGDSASDRHCVTCTCGSGGAVQGSYIATTESALDTGNNEDDDANDSVILADNGNNEDDANGRRQNRRRSSQSSSQVQDRSTHETAPQSHNSIQAGPRRSQRRSLHIQENDNENEESQPKVLRQRSPNRTSK